MKRLEDNIQIACVKWFKYAYPAYILHHSPNGGKRTAFEAEQFKRMGTIAGFPDLFLMCSSGFYNGLFVEIKTEKGRQTESQKWFEKKAFDFNYCYKVVRSLDEFIEVITNYLK